MAKNIKNIRSFAQIGREIAATRGKLDAVEAARSEAKQYLAYPSPIYAARLEKRAAAVGHRSFRLLAQGDSWFDYPPGTDIVDCLHANHGHVFSGAGGAVTVLAVAGSTLNDEAYGPVPTNLWGIPQSGDVSRIAELVNRIKLDKPDALLLSAGGNDIAGPEFFSLINNANSSLPEVNDTVVKGVLDETFKAAFKYLIDNAIAAAKTAKITLPIFVHGYDYPWPDGRGVIDVPFFKIGPWFDESFNQKNYFNRNASELNRRYRMVKSFVDPLNGLLQELQTEYKDRVFHVDLRGQLPRQSDWANELHPKNPGFAKLAAVVDGALQMHV